MGNRNKNIDIYRAFNALLFTGVPEEGWLLQKRVMFTKLDTGLSIRGCTR
jgi:hypothetical protein